MRTPTARHRGTYSGMIGRFGGLLRQACLSGWRRPAIQQSNEGIL